MGPLWSIYVTWQSSALASMEPHGAPNKKSSTLEGIGSLHGTCKDRCGFENMEAMSVAPTSMGSIWPQLADAIATSVDGIKGTVVSPKCAHLAGFNAPLGGESMLTCLENIGFKPSGGRALSTVSSRVASCVQPTKRLAPTILPEGLGPTAHLAVALQTKHLFSRPPQLDRMLSLQSHRNPPLRLL